MIPTIGKWPQAPDLIEPIIGYRAWRFVSDERGVRLLSFAYADDDTIGGWDGAWRRWVTAYCPVVAGKHAAPDEACTCGFYATKARDDSQSLVMLLVMAEASDGPEPASAGTGAVFGCVRLAGKVIEHDFGYRGQHARIEALIPTTIDGGVTESLAARLDLPLGPAIDARGVIEAAKELMPPPIPAPRRLGPLERVRLKTHRRHFRLITGDAEAR